MCTTRGDKHNIISITDAFREAKSEMAGREFLSPTPSFLPAPPERRFSAARNAAVIQSFSQRKFERRSVIATKRYFLIFETRRKARPAPAGRSEQSIAFKFSKSLEWSGRAVLSSSRTMRLTKLGHAPPRFFKYKGINKFWQVFS